MSYTIRPMTLMDLDAVYEIERTAHVAPWTKQIIHDCVVVGYACFVLVKRKKVRGFSISRIKAGVCHLLNLCIDIPYQGKGFGKALLVDLLAEVKDSCVKVTLEVRPSNQAAQQLYAQFQFKQTGYQKNYYTNPDGSVEDGIVLTKSL